jgi:hypothetical protein
MPAKRPDWAQLERVKGDPDAVSLCPGLARRGDVEIKLHRRWPLASIGLSIWNLNVHASRNWPGSRAGIRVPATRRGVGPPVVASGTRKRVPAGRRHIDINRALTESAQYWLDWQCRMIVGVSRGVVYVASDDWESGAERLVSWPKDAGDSAVTQGFPLSKPLSHETVTALMANPSAIRRTLRQANPGKSQIAGGQSQALAGVVSHARFG